MLEHKVLYTSDTHGNTRQLKALVEYALKIEPDTIIIAGELTPNKKRVGTLPYLSSQRKFLQNELPVIIRRLKERLPDTTVFVTLGNDDCAVNAELLDSHPELYLSMHGRRVQLAEGNDIVGYSFVPITPFGLKDFEKHDLSRVSASDRDEYARLLNNASCSGVKSTPEGWMGHTFSSVDALENSIQRDLEDPLFTVNAEKTVYLFHTPPHGTVLDVIYDQMTGETVHVGSFAVRDFIQQYQPLVTLHGHVHETVDLSGGQFREQIVSSSMSSGNDNYASRLSVLVFDLYSPETAQRIQLPCTTLGKLTAKLF